MKTKWIKTLSAMLAALMLMSGFVACDKSKDDETDTESAGTTADTTTGTSADTSKETTAGTSAETPAETGEGTSADTTGATGTDVPAESDTAAGTTTETSATTTPSETDAESSDIQAALDALGEIDFGKRDFGILHQDTFKSEVYAKDLSSDSSGSTSDVINEAVFTRNSLLEDRCNLQIAYIERDVSSLSNLVANEASAPTGDFHLIDTYIFNNASMAAQNYLANMNRLGTDLEGEWWDKGTADFVLKGGVYFMSGSLTFGDDNVTYVLIFNKDMQKTYANTVPNPYDTVRASEWTLDYFNQIIQGISAENGNGTWGAEDTYGFVTTWEYGTTFFHGADMRYVLNDATTDAPTLYLAESGRMEKALNVIELSQKIYHENHATFMSPGGQENLGTTAFQEGRAMFFGDTCMYIAHFNSTMTGEYGVLPIPKYDKEQEFYRTWTHASGSSFSATNAIPEDDREVVGQILSAYAILSHQYVKPAYYDKVLTSRNVRDPDSVEMLDILFQNRVYDMAFYFDLGLGDLVKNAVNNNNDTFSSGYKRVASRFDKKVDNYLNKLEDN